MMNYREKPPDTSRIAQLSPIKLKNQFEPLDRISAAFIMKNESGGDTKGWILYCGATDTMAPNKDDFVSFGDITKTYI